MNIQSPLTTLIGRGGTLESVHVLVASVLIALCHRVILIEFEDHFSLGVGGASGMPGHYVEHEGDRFYFVGWVTGDGWVVGELPGELADAVTGTVNVLPA